MIRLFFNTISPRERLLLVAIIWIAIFLWALALVKTFREHKSVFVRTGNELKTQQVTLDERTVLQERLRALKSQFEAAKTYSAPQMVARLDNLARATQVNVDISSPSTDRSETFMVHTARMQIKRAELKDLIQLDHLIRQETPYLGMERIQIIANSREPRFLDATYEVVAFELLE